MTCCLIENTDVTEQIKQQVMVASGYAAPLEAGEEVQDQDLAEEAVEAEIPNS